MKTFFFAAGASMPFFENSLLSTKYLTQKVQDISEWENVIKKYISKKGPNTAIAEPQFVVNVIKKILLYAPKANFEQIAEVLDKISSYSIDRMSINMMNLVQLVLMDMLNNTHVSLNVEMQGIPFLFREIIAEAILELEKNHKSGDYDKLLNMQNSFIAYAAKEKEEASIISTNYDNCVPNSLNNLNFDTCFIPVDYRYKNLIDIQKFMNAPRVVYYPHGHLRFHFTDNDNVTYWHNSEIANQERWDGLDFSAIGSTLTSTPGKFSYNFNTFITTGQTKDDSFNHLPYAIYYQRMACDIAKSDTVYIIGYSFGDDHFNRLMKSFLKLKDTNKVVIVDYYPDTINMVNEYQDQNNIISKIWDVFGTEWSIIIDSKGQNKLAFNQLEVDKLNAYGFGEIFKNVYFYKRGYKDFLNDYKKIIDNL